jgi:spermidine/putrescine ABC transporter ATP-binding subunit
VTTPRLTTPGLAAPLLPAPLLSAPLLSVPLLSVRGLTVRFGATTALDALDLDIHAGEMFVLLGASGSGKTTLLRAVAGFVRPDAGQIELDGADLGTLPPHKRPVNTMFQSYALFPHLNVAANVGFGLRQQGMPRAAISARVEEMLTLVSLPGYAARKPHQLSGGQQQRVALARSLAPSPRLLLLDEPLSALDRNLREETRQELARLQRQLGTTFVVVTHDQEEALTLATRIGVMREGRLAQVGTPADVYEHPVDRFVAEFLGAANILPVNVGTGGVMLDLPGLGTSIRAAMPVPVETTLLALRPERLRLDGSGLNQISGVLVERAYAGEALIHTVRLADGTLLRVSEALRDGLSAAATPIGAAVTVSWQPEACIVLPG